VIAMHRQSDGSTRAILNDIGLCRLVWAERPSSEEPTGVTPTDAAIGTLLYMAPEQIVCARDVTSAVDAYAVGWTLYRAVAGRHAFESPTDGNLARRKLSEDPPALRTGRADALARGFEEIVTQSIRLAQHDRFSSAALLLSELERLRTFGTVLRASTSIAPGGRHDTTGPLAYGSSSLPAPRFEEPPRSRAAWAFSGLGVASAVAVIAYSLMHLSTTAHAPGASAMAPAPAAPPVTIAPSASTPTVLPPIPAAAAPAVVATDYHCASGALSVDASSKVALLGAMRPHAKTTIAPIVVEAFGDTPGAAGMALAERRARIARLLMTHVGVAQSRVIARPKDLADEPGAAGVVRVRFPGRTSE
jgi:hypothetical protein